MKLTVEISLYPMRPDYVPPIRDFIALLNGHPGLRVTTYPTSTVLVGDFDQVMSVLAEAMKVSYRRFGMEVFVTKFLSGYDADDAGLANTGSESRSDSDP